MRLAVLPLAIAVFGIAGCGDDDDTEKSSSESASRGGGTLFVQTTGAGRLASQGDGAYELTLPNPAQTVTTFSDRPERVASREALATFVSNWEGRGFESDPPNAALVTGEGNAERTVILELSNPRLDGRELSYRAEPVKTAASGALARVARDADDPAPGGFGEGQLFIDDASSGPVIPMFINLTINNAGPTTNVEMDFNSPVQGTGFTFSLPGPANGVAVGNTIGINGSGQYQIQFRSPIQPIAGTASVRAPANATVSVNGGKAQPLKSGKFSFDSNLGAGEEAPKPTPVPPAPKK